MSWLEQILSSWLGAREFDIVPFIPVGITLVAQLCGFWVADWLKNRAVTALAKYELDDVQGGAVEQSLLNFAFLSQLYTAVFPVLLVFALTAAAAKDASLTTSRGVYALLILALVILVPLASTPERLFEEFPDDEKSRRMLPRYERLLVGLHARSWGDVLTWVVIGVTFIYQSATAYLSLATAR